MKIQGVAAWVAVIGFIIGGVWLVYQYDERIRTLETRVNILLGSQPERATIEQSSDQESNEQPSSAEQSEICNALALRRVEAIETGKTFTQGGDIRTLMIEMNCIVE